MAGRDPYSDADDEERELRREAPSGRFREFDCSGCNANNPTEEFGAGDEVQCHYCGTSFQVNVGEGNKLKLREI